MERLVRTIDLLEGRRSPGGFDTVRTPPIPPPTSGWNRATLTIYAKDLHGETTLAHPEGRTSAVVHPEAIFTEGLPRTERAPVRPGQTVRAVATVPEGGISLGARRELWDDVPSMGREA